MKNLVVIMLALVMLALLPSCAVREGRERMALIDSLIADNPDSALKLLLAMPSGQHKSGENEARFNMLLTEAVYKSDSVTLPDSINPLISDSIIGISVAYYELHGEPSDKARSRYFAGIVDYENGDYNGAIIDFLTAKKYSGNSNNHYGKALIYRAIADCFDQMHDMSGALNYYHMASEEFAKTPYRLYYDYSLFDEARMHICLKNFSEVIKLLESCERSALIRNDSCLIIDVLRLRGQCEMQMGQFNKAISTFQSIMKTNISAMTPRDYSFLGSCLLAEGNYSAAKQFLDSSLSSKYSIVDFYLGNNTLLQEILAYEKDYKTAYEKSIEDFAYKSEVIQQVWARDFNSVIEHFYKTEERIVAEHNKKIKDHFFFIIILFSILAIIGILVYQIRVNKLKRKMNAGMLIANNLRSELLIKDREVSSMASTISKQKTELSDISDEIESTRIKLERAIRERDRQEKDKLSMASNMKSLECELQSREENQLHLNESIRMLLGEKFDIIDHLCLAYCTNQTKSDEKTRIYKQVMLILSSLKDDEKVACQLETLINAHANNLIKRIREQLPDLSESEIKLYIFSVLGMSNTSMSFIFDVNYNTICVRKSKLKRKLKTSMAEDAEIFSQYMS